jgi:hypothetical protein
MNDLLKFFSNSLKPFGYHITDYNAPNVLRIANLDREEELQAFRKAQYGQNLTQDANLDHMIVYLRVCMRKNRNIDPKPRLTGQNIEENTLRCVNSLIKSMSFAKDNGKIELVVLDDRSDKEPLAKLTKILETANFPWSIAQTTTTGQGASLHEQFTRGRAENAITYFVEDDFLHEQDGILAAWRFYQQVYKDFKTHSLIHPQEHQILADKLYPSYHRQPRQALAHYASRHAHLYDAWTYCA